MKLTLVAIFQIIFLSLCAGAARKTPKRSAGRSVYHLLNIILIKLTILILFQDEIRANEEKRRLLESLKPPKKDQSAAEMRKEAERKKIADRNGYLAYQCQCRSCLYRRGFLDEGCLLEADYDNV